ncbi:ThuA domain-containing protein [Thermostilla marina]
MSRIDRRRFIFHTAHGTLGLSAGMAAFRSREVLAEFIETESPSRPAAPPLRLCLVSGSFEYESDKSLDWFAAYVKENFGIECDKAYAPSVDELPGLDALDRCDCMVLFTRRLEIKGESLEKIKRYLTSGKPVVGIRTASHAFQNWLELDKEVFGGDYQGHFGKTIYPKIETAPGAADHPIVQGFKPYVSKGSLYKNPSIAPDTTVLLQGSIPESTQPVAWTRTYKGARVFYTSLGHQDDFRQASFVGMLIRAIYWVCRREIPEMPR